MSVAIFDAPTIAPVRSRIGEIVTHTSTSVPSLRRRTVSNGSTRLPARTFARTRASSSCRSSGMMIRIGWPTASSAVYPNSRSAPWFHAVTTPSRSLATIASLLDSTIAANRLRSISALRTRWPSAESSTPLNEKSVSEIRSAVSTTAPARGEMYRSTAMPAESAVSAGPKPPYQADNVTAG